MNSIYLNKVSFGYKANELILRDITLAINSNSFLGITGVNGSGKTTLTYLLNGLIPHFFKGNLKGEILVDGLSTQSRSISFFAQKIGMVFQNPDFSLFNLTVEEEIAFGLKNLKGHWSKKMIGEALTSAGLKNFSQRDPQTLSYGEKQKVNLACILALQPDYIVLDEPTSMLDYKSSLQIYQILQKLNKLGKTIIVVEHDTDFLWQFAKKVIILERGKIKAMGKTQSILSRTRLLKKLGIKIPNQKAIL